MITVTKAYLQEMDQPLRKQGHMKLIFGNNLFVTRWDYFKYLKTNDELAYFSVQDVLLASTLNVVQYGTLEEGFTKVDGTMFFPPRENETLNLINTDMLTKKTIPTSGEGFYLKFFLPYVDSGDTVFIDFGENYPVDFIIKFTSYDGVRETHDTEHIFTGNTESQIITDIYDDPLPNYGFRYMYIIPLRMRNENSRMRIMGISNGGKYTTIDDSYIIDSSLRENMGELGIDIPQLDFTVTLKKYSPYIEEENPIGEPDYLKKGTRFRVLYGLELGQNSNITPIEIAPKRNHGDATSIILSNDRAHTRIEWFIKATLVVTSWESDRDTITIHAADKFRSNEGFYYGENMPARDTYYPRYPDEICGGCNRGYVQRTDISNPNFKFQFHTSDSYYFDDNMPFPIVAKKEMVQLLGNLVGFLLGPGKNLKDIVLYDNNNTYFNPKQADSEDVKICYRDMIDYPVTVKKEQTKEINVHYYTYRRYEDQGADEETLLDDDIEIDENLKYIHTLPDTYYITETEWSNEQAELRGFQVGRVTNWVTVKFPEPGSYHLLIKGKRHIKNDQYVTQTLSSEGRIVHCENPMIFTKANAERTLRNMLKLPYNPDFDLYYEFSTRGLPHLSIGDYVYQENKYIPNMKVIVVENVTNFNGAFSGKMKTLRWRGGN